MGQQVVEGDRRRERGRSVLGRQEVDHPVVEGGPALLDEAERADRGRHLRDRGHGETGLGGDRHAEPAMGETADMLEDRSAFAPHEHRAAERTGFGAPVEPLPGPVEIHLDILSR